MVILYLGKVILYEERRDGVFHQNRLLQIGSILLILSLFLSGCSLFTTATNNTTKEGSQMTPEEEQKVRDAAVQYIQDTYQKEFVIEEINKDQVFGNSYDINGYIKDGKNTPVYITGKPGDFQDSYVSQLWTDELTPHLKQLFQKHLDLRNVNTLSYTDGTKKTNYKGEIPSVFDVLEKGEKDFTLQLTLDVYEQNGQVETGITQLLQDLKQMNFNKVIITIFVYDDQLKSDPDNQKPQDQLLTRYNISGDIQQMNITNLESYKTVIKK